jgi:hypothetical protein
VKRPKLRWLGSLLLITAFYPGLARNADAQVDTTYSIGNIVEFQYNSGPKVWAFLDLWSQTFNSDGLQPEVETDRRGGATIIFLWAGDRPFARRP